MERNDSFVVGMKISAEGVGLEDQHFTKNLGGFQLRECDANCKCSILSGKPSKTFMKFNSLHTPLIFTYLFDAMKIFPFRTCRHCIGVNILHHIYSNLISKFPPTNTLVSR